MAVPGDLTIAQDGSQGNVKLHPYLVTLVRWCVSCLWSTATVLLHRLMTTPLQPVTGPKPHPPKIKLPKRTAGTEHLHPEPTVECQLLHQPDLHTMDVIFVHGLYGSLGNTWRQGEWRQKYKTDPQKVPLRNHSTPSCVCHVNSYDDLIYNVNENTDLNDQEITLNKINEKLSKKIIPRENELITEQFYNNTLLDQVEIHDNYDTQAKFVSDLFKKENCDNESLNNQCTNDNKYNNDNYIGINDYKCNNDNYTENNDYKCNCDQYNCLKCNYSGDNDNNKCNYNEMNEFNHCKCNFNEKKCEMGCGCICNDCYSSCWPKDWIKMDFPGARVISINYTSDPYLWRPLWIKENKRLNLYQRAHQMINQLLAMGVGEKPIIWVGHSKGGLFIKQIYCEAYEAHVKTNQNPESNSESTEIAKKGTTNMENNGITAENIDAIIGHFSHNEANSTGNNDSYMGNNDNYFGNNDIFMGNNDSFMESNDNYVINNDNITNNSCVMNETETYKNVFEQINEKAKIASANIQINNVDNLYDLKEINVNGKYEKMRRIDLECGKGDEDASNLEESRRSVSSLYRCSRGFMFYSVPHRGSPLADIKTPVTARSVDLLEIAKDCPLVLSLQERWERATRHADGRVSVRSFVETCRTLMSVLWLRIVSTDSADAGIGTLSGVSVDHREICKPSSRKCLLYTELTDLINEALKCKCQ